MNIGKVIHRIRNEAKLTQAQFSEIFGKSVFFYVIFKKPPILIRS